MPRAARYLSLRKAVVELGLATAGDEKAIQREARKLSNRLRSRQEELGKKFVRRSGAGRNAAILVTIPMLREHLPELFSRRDDLAGMIAKLRQQQEDERDRLRLDIGASISAIETRLARIERHVGIMGR